MDVTSASKNPVVEKSGPVADTPENDLANGRPEEAFTDEDGKKLDSKEVLERVKLHAEADEIKGRHQLSKRTFFQNEIRTWVTIVGGLLTGLGAVLTVFIQGSN